MIIKNHYIFFFKTKHLYSINYKVIHGDNMEIKDITQKTSNSEKLSLLSKLAVELSDVTTLSQSVYIGTYNNEALYLNINEPNIYYKYLGFHITLKEGDNGDIMLNDEGLRNLHFLILRIDNHNKKENDFINKLREIL